jgi:tRNA G18 (ribose-2'-O)-methylase SpoU
LDDPRLAAYRDMKDRDLARNGDRFIAEGEQVVRRLLASRLRTESVLIAERKLEVIGPLVPAGVQLWTASDETIQKVIGFEFHSGVLACGVRPPPVELEEILGRPGALPEGRSTLMICPKITNVDNLGSLVRIAAAFGVRAMILGEKCCDPFFRHSVRVSMGAVFKVPIARGRDIISDLARLRESWGFDVVGTVISPDAQALAQSRRGENIALVFGGEADGLDAQTIAASDRCVTIPMRRGTDSLNVSVAAGIVLYHFVDVCAETA